jgi:DNA-binding LytR/AlgR family response regulator
MLNCIAVDDEKLVLELLADNIRQVPFLHLVAKCRNALEAIDVLHREKVDLIFLDIQMPGLNGLQFLRSLQQPPMVIFVTAYKDYAFDGFNLDAIDYLLKPVSFERFLKACNKAFLHQQQQSVQQDDKPPAYFFVYVEYNQVKINIPEILYIEGMKDYVKIFLSTSTKPVITRMSLKAMEEKLLPHRFVRCHKSYIVAADKVTAIKRDLLCIGDAELPLSDSYKAEVERMLSL